MKILARMYASRYDRRGLGDAVQFNIVLKHIKHYFPSWKISIETTRGKETCHSAYIENAYLVEEGGAPLNQFDKIIDFKFDEPNKETCSIALAYNVPPTKPTFEIKKTLNVDPIRSFYNYDILIDERTRRIAQDFLNTIPKNNGLIMIHYEAASSPQNKNIDVNDVKNICQSLIQHGYTPIIFDWKSNSPLPDSRNIFRIDKNNSIWNQSNAGNAKMIAALIEYCRLFVGVDSGPLHIAASQKTPTIGFWKKHHPVHYFDLSNVLHLVPGDCMKYIKNDDKRIIDNYFINNYKHEFYHGNHAESILNAIIKELNVKIIETPKPYIHEFIVTKNGQWWPMKI